MDRSSSKPPDTGQQRNRAITTSNIRQGFEPPAAHRGISRANSSSSSGSGDHRILESPGSSVHQHQHVFSPSPTAMPPSPSALQVRDRRGSRLSSGSSSSLSDHRPVDFAGSSSSRRTSSEQIASSTRERSAPGYGRGRSESRSEVIATVQKLPDVATSPSQSSLGEESPVRYQNSMQSYRPESIRLLRDADTTRLGEAALLRHLGTVRRVTGDDDSSREADACLTMVPVKVPVAGESSEESKFFLWVMEGTYTIWK